MRRICNTLVLFAAAGLTAACSHTHEAQRAVPQHATLPALATPSELAAPMTKERQARITPDIALRRLQDGNDRFVHGHMLKRDLRDHIKVTGHGQYPIASVVTCIDSRSGPELVFDQGIGDVFTARVAGNIVNKDILGSLEYAAAVAGSKLVVVLGHSHCGAIKGACDNVKMGNLTGLLDKLQPAVSSVPKDGTARDSHNHDFVEKVAEANVELTVRDILDQSPLLKQMVKEGKIAVVGAMLDVETGHVEFLPAYGLMTTAASRH
jgi:carbonic anhydrase